MDRKVFDEYIRRFNAEDPTVFDEYLSPNMKMLNGALEFTGIEGMRDHYENKMWPFFHERLNVLRFVSSDGILAIQMWTNFEAKRDAETIFGSARKGEMFDFRGLIMYDIENGKFATITVAYNSFRNTKVTGEVIEMGIPH
jgi:hypothetical protein